MKSSNQIALFVVVVVVVVVVGGLLQTKTNWKKRHSKSSTLRSNEQAVQFSIQPIEISGEKEE